MRKSLFKPLGLMAFAAFAFLIGNVAIAQVPAKPPVEAFFDNATFSDVKLSPTGRHVAVKVVPRGGRNQLIVLNTETLSAKMVAGYADTDIGSVDWVTDDRLVFTLVDLAVPVDSTRSGGGLYTVLADGSKVQEAMGRDKFGGAVITSRRKLTADVFVAPPRPSRDDSPVYFGRMNALNPRDGKLYKAPAGVTQWFLDHNDEPRLTVGIEGKFSVVRYLESAEQWRELARFPAIGSDGFKVVGFGPDGALYVTAANGKDRAALHKFDLTANRLDPEPVLALVDFDFTGDLVMDSGQNLLGVRYMSDAPSTHWFDSRLKQVQGRVDALLPGTSNLIDVPLRPQVPLLLVRSVSDANAGTYSLFNTLTGKLVPIGQSRRGIDVGQMGTKDLVRYKARDGMDIPAWLTQPKGAAKTAKLPLVVLVHDGPWERGANWSWDAESQFLASRGYAVLAPEFRGSTGYGFKHYRAGWKQWGLAMQDDIADGVQWAIAKGAVDPSRICIIGGGYGGYAALMGLVKNPEIFRCGVAWSSVAGIDSLLEQGGNVYKTVDMPLLLADPGKDAEQIALTSPLLNAARIKQPVLLAHGSSNSLVPIRPIVRLRDAVRRTNPDVEWVEYADEGHEWHLAKTRVDFWTRVEKFLERNVGATISTHR